MTKTLALYESGTIVETENCQIRANFRPSPSFSAHRYRPFLRSMQSVLYNIYDLVMTAYAGRMMDNLPPLEAVRGISEERKPRPVSRGIGTYKTAGNSDVRSVLGGVSLPAVTGTIGEINVKRGS